MTIGKSQKNRDAVTDDVASLAPAECAAIRERASNGSIGPADYSFQGAKRGSVVRPGMAPYTMAPHPRRAVISSLFLALFLAVAVFCGLGLGFGPGQAQAQVLDDQSTETKIETNGQHRQVEQNYAVDEEDTQRVRRFRKLVPSALRGWLPEVRPQAHSRTPVLTFRHWMNERKRFPGVFLFCIFVGLLGTAFFPKQLATAGECCRSQFWTCLGRAILTGVTLIISIIILDRLVITESLGTLLIAVLQLALIAGLSVGVWLLGDRMLEKTRLSNLQFFKTHPRLHTLAKLLFGSLLLALVVQIPGVGKLPPIGIRIAVLIAILGAGGLLKTKLGTQPLPSPSE